MTSLAQTTILNWSGAQEGIAFDDAGIYDVLNSTDCPCYVVKVNGQTGFTSTGRLTTSENGIGRVMAWLPPLSPEMLGDETFRQHYGVKYAYAAGAMANGIASIAMVTTLGKALILSSFGAAGFVPQQIEEAIHQIQSALPSGPYAFNLIHSPHEEAIEQSTVQLYLKHAVTTVEASAFLSLTPHIVRYRVAGLARTGDRIQANNRVIAKISRREIAQQFMEPAPENILAYLLSQRWITEEQAALARHIPVADDVTVEADSGGHTDNRPLVSLLPVIISLRDEIQQYYHYPIPSRVGVGGGIGTPEAVLMAFMMGAAYVVTGSINQSCIEAGTSDHTKKLLGQAEMTDVIMAPAADMFEMGVKVQLLKRGTMFPMRAQKLFDLYQSYDSLESIPIAERQKIESQILRRSFNDVWQDTVNFFMNRDPRQVELANRDPKRKMALIFRWYLGLSSRWSNSGEPGRELDYQIWCGPSMGAFNNWVKGTYLESPAQRRVVDIAGHLMHGAAYLYRVQSLRLQNVQIPSTLARYMPGLSFR